MEQRERALARRHVRKGQELAEHTKKLSELEIGQVVLVQNQTGKNPLRWEKSGQVVEVMGFDQYRVKIDGSGRVSVRNRRFLKPITPYSSIDRHRMGDTDILQEDDDNQVEGSVPRRSDRTRRPPERYGLAG